MIETVEEWNTRLGYCGCCPMPVCPQLVGVAEQKTASACGFRFPFYHPSITTEDKARFFKTATEAMRYEEADTYASSQAYRDTTATYSASKNTERISTKEKVSGVCEISHVTEQNQLSYNFSEVADNPGEWEDDDLIPYHETVEIDSEYLKVDGTVITNSGTRTEYNAMADPTTTITDYFVGFPSFNFFNLSLNSWDYEPLATRFTLQPGIFGETPNTLWSVEFADEITPEEIDAEVEAMDWANTGFSGVSAKRFNGSSPSTSIYRKLRFRFRIPNTHLGSKFTITYDVAEFPEDEEVDPSFVSQDNVVEWTGPGNQEDPDGDSWLTPWVELNPPEISGERRIVNIRYTCYTGTKYGVKPQVMGEAFEPPAP
jgi:hypothetical protein